MTNRICFVLILFLSFAPAYAQTKMAWRPFDENSPWNTRISSDAAADPDSKVLIESLALGPFYININDWSIPVYYVDSDTAQRIDVINSRPGIYGRGFQEPNRIPLLPGFVASPPVGEFSDNHMCIVDTSKMIEWGMWATRKDSLGRWTTGLGAVTDLKGTGVEKPWYEQKRDLDAHRARASGFPLIAGLIRPEEIAAGRIDHALVFAYQRGRSEFFIPPASTAQATQMEMSNRFGIPMGGRIQLDPSIDVDTLKLNPACRIIARALQEYGAYNGDYAGATVLYADNSPAALLKWKGVLSKEDLLSVFTPDFIRKYFRVIKMGRILPGQNLDNAEYGFSEFTFPGCDSTYIDWLNLTIRLWTKENVDLGEVVPEFKAIRNNAVVTLDGAIQKSGKSKVDMSRPVSFKVLLQDGNSRNWTIVVDKN